MSVTYKNLVSKYGKIEAMRTLEMVELLASRLRLGMTPDERLEIALGQLCPNDESVRRNSK